jgi:hypothetical protein
MRAAKTPKIIPVQFNYCLQSRFGCGGLFGWVVLVATLTWFGDYILTLRVDPASDIRSEKESDGGQRQDHQDG